MIEIHCYCLSRPSDHECTPGVHCAPPWWAWLFAERACKVCRTAYEVEEKLARYFTNQGSVPTPVAACAFLLRTEEDSREIETIGPARLIELVRADLENSEPVMLWIAPRTSD